MTSPRLSAADALAAAEQRKTELVFRCEVIVSAPQTLEWSPPYAVGHGGLGITSKLGFRVYVGLEDPAFKDGKGPRLGSMRHFQPGNAQTPFAELSRDALDILERQIHDVLNPKSKSTKTDTTDFNIDVIIHVLSEFPFFRGLHADATLAATLSAALHLYCGDITPGELRDLVNTEKTEHLIKNPKFQSMFGLAWRLERATTEYRPEGHHLFAAFVKSAAPVLFWRSAGPQDSKLDEDPFGFHPNGCKLGEALVESKSTEVPEGFNPIGSIDAALIFLGREVDSLQVLRSHFDQVTREISDRYGSAMTGIRTLLPKEKEKLPRFGRLDPGKENIAPAHRGALQNHAGDLLVVQSVRTFEALCKVVNRGIGAGALRDFIMRVDGAQDLYRLFELSSGYVDEPIHVLRAEGRRLLRQKVGARLVGPGRAGCVLLLAARGSLKYALPTLLQKVQEAVNPDTVGTVHDHWTSERDGYSPRGEALRVEMDTDNDIFALSNDEAPFVIHVWEGIRALPKRMMTEDEWLAVKPKFAESYDLAFDYDEKKLWREGKEVPKVGTSGDLSRLLLKVLLSSSKRDVDGKHIQEALRAASTHKTNSGYAKAYIQQKIFNPLFDVLNPELASKQALSDQATTPSEEKTQAAGCYDMKIKEKDGANPKEDGETRFYIRLTFTKRVALVYRKNQSNLRRQQQRDT